MRKVINMIDETERNIDWEDVERKISIIVYKFNNINPSYREDLAQELRIHAYYFSDDYYDLYRAAVDYWRRLTRKEYPEVPFIDLDLMSSNFHEFDNVDGTYESIVVSIRKELNKEYGKNIKQKDLDKIANLILDVICEDIEGNSNKFNDEGTTVSMYYSGRINITYLDQLFPDIHYKRLQKALKRIEAILLSFKEKGLL